MSSIRESRRARTARSLAVVLVLGVRTAAAQQATTDAAMAETLFADGKKRMAAGDYAGACPKFAESYRLDPGSGTLTALALCHEQVGKTASAWAEFIEVVTEAQQGGRADREKFAKQHLAALVPTLSRLTINVSAATANLRGIEVHRDQVVVGNAAWGVASPVDPGEHVIEATAPHKAPWSIRVTVGASGDEKAVSIPELTDTIADKAESSSVAEGSPGPEVPKATEASDSVQSGAGSGERSGGPQRTLGAVIGGVGLAALGVGTYFGVQAISNSSSAKQLCSPSQCTNPTAVRENADARSEATAADVTLGMGLVAAVVGGYLFFSAPSHAPAAGPPKTGLSLVPTLRVQGVHEAAMTLHATW